MLRYVRYSQLFTGATRLGFWEARENTQDETRETMTTLVHSQVHLRIDGVAVESPCDTFIDRALTPGGSI